MLFVVRVELVLLVPAINLPRLCEVSVHAASVAGAVKVVVVDSRYSFVAI